MDKKFWLVIGAIAAIFIGIWYFGNGDSKNNSDTGNAKASNHVKGNIDSKVTLLEYGDFQCPVCGGYYPTVSEVMEKYHDKIKFQFRNLPLTQQHQHALVASRAAEAASKQGKFWEMYEQLFANQSTWSASNQSSQYFEQYAGQIGLNVAQYKTDLANRETNQIVNADVAEFNKTGDRVQTPTFYLNGKKIDLTKLIENDRPSVAKFSALIDAALKESETSQQ